MSELALLKTSQELDLGQIETISIISPKGISRRDELLMEAENVETITSANSQQIAANVLSDVNGFLTMMEKQRAQLKAPYLAIGRKIDGDIGAAVKKLEAEKERLKKLLGNYTVKLQQEAAAEQARQDQKIAELEAQRQQATTQEQAAQIDQQIGNAMAPVEVAKPKGVAITPTRKFRVVDIHLLYKSRPDCCDIQPKTAAINSLIRDPANKDLKIPGIEIYEEVDVRTSSR